MPDTLSSPNLAAQARAAALAAPSGAFLLHQVAGGMAGMDGRDSLLVMAINQANIAPLTRDPNARLRYGGLDSPAPDQVRRPVSLSAIAASLSLPYETVRRRAGRLRQAGVLEITDHGAIVPESFLASPAYLNSVVAAHARLYRFFCELRAAGLMEALPPSRYPPEPSVPIRASLRPLAEYLLRTSENLTALTGEMIAGLAFFGLIGAGSSLPPPASSVAEIARGLAMPHETIRRHLAALAEAGWATRVGRGFTVSQAVIERPAMQALLRDNAVNLHRLFTTLAERGVVEAWDRLGVPGG